MHLGTQSWIGENVSLPHRELHLQTFVIKSKHNQWPGHKTDRTVRNNAWTSPGQELNRRYCHDQNHVGPYLDIRRFAHTRDIYFKSVRHGKQRIRNRLKWKPQP